MILITLICFKVIKYLVVNCDKADIDCIGRMKSMSYLHGGTKPAYQNLDYLKTKMSSEEVSSISPLVASIIHEDVDLMKLLLQAGASFHRPMGDSNFFPFMHAVKTNNSDIVKTLIFSGKKGNAFRSPSMNGFYIALAAKKGYVLEASIDRNEQLQTGNSLIKPLIIKMLM